MEEIEAVAEAKGLLSRPIFSENIDLAASVIKAGGVVICPAEGVYGFSCIDGRFRGSNRYEGYEYRHIGLDEQTVAGALYLCCSMFE